MSILNVILTIIYILLTHFVADFIMQSDEMAKGKSTSTYWLTKHVFSYAKTFLLSAIIYYSILALSGYSGCNMGLAWLMIYFVIINGFFHWCTDYLTSKQVKEYFDRQDFHRGFIVIGLDQFTHATTLILTFYLIFLK